MNLIVNLNNSLVYTKKLLDDGARIIILIILNLIPVVNWIVLGYGVRVLRETPNSEAPPKLENYGGLFIDGAKVFFAISIYMIVPIIIIILGAASLFADAFSIQTAGNALALGGVGVTIVLVGVILSFILLILLGVGIAHIAKTGKFSKAFAFGEIIKIVNGIGKAKYLGWVIITGLIAILVVGLAASVPYIGWLLSTILSPFLTVFIFRSLGILYNDRALPELKITNVSSEIVGIRCVTCGAPLLPHHKFCPACGAPAPSLDTVDGTRFCIACGKHIPATVSFCGFCGAKQN